MNLEPPLNYLVEVMLENIDKKDLEFFLKDLKDKPIPQDIHPDTLKLAQDLEDKLQQRN